MPVCKIRPGSDGFAAFPRVWFAGNGRSAWSGRSGGFRCFGTLRGWVPEAVQPAELAIQVGAGHVGAGGQHDLARVDGRPAEADHAVARLGAPRATSRVPPAIRWTMPMWSAGGSALSTAAAGSRNRPPSARQRDSSAASTGAAGPVRSGAEPPRRR